MEIIRAIVILVGLGALVGAVVRAREPGTFPLATLVQRWFSRTPSPGLLLIGAAAGISTVVVVPVIDVLSGRAEITPAGPLSGRWVALAVVGAAVKTAFVFFEELIFRGALVSELRRWTGSAVAVGASALVFAAAHSGRSSIDMAILFADGIGFAFAFVATGSLWVPAVWHFSKNLSVWLFFGSGTIDVTHGPFAFRQLGSGQVPASPESAGLLDLGMTILVVALVTWSLIHRRKRDTKAV